MLQSMREKMQGIIAGAVVALITIPFLLWGIQNYLHGNAASDVVATVDGVKITGDSLHRAYSRAQQQEMAHQSSSYNLDQKNQAILKDQVLKQIIKDEALTKETDRLGLYVGQQELNAALTGLPIFQQNGSFSQDRFQQVLGALNYSLPDFTAELKRMILLGQLETGVRSSSFVLPNEVDNAIKLKQQTRNFGYLVLANQRFAKDVAVSDSEIQQYYNNHKSEFLSPELVSLEFVELKANDLKDKVVIDDVKLQQFYKDNGNLFALEKGAAAEPFAKVKDKVKAAYLHQQVQQLLTEQNDKLTDLTYTNSDSLIQASTELSLPIQTTGLFTSVGDKGGANGAEISANPKVIKAAFSDAVLHQGYNSNPLEIAQGDVVVLRVKQHIAESVKPLTEVSKTIEQKLKSEKMHAAAKKTAEEVMQGLQNKQDPIELSKKYAAVWQVQTNIGREGSKIDPMIVKAVFALPKVKSNKTSSDQVFPIGLVDLQDKGYAVVQNNKVHDGDVKQVNAKERKNIENNLQNDWNGFEYDVLTGQIMKNAKIKIEKVEKTVASEPDSE